MKRMFMGLALVAVGALAACADATDDQIEMDVDETMPARETPPLADDMASGEGLAMMLGVGHTAQGEAYLTDAEGRALYLLEGDPRGGSTCYDACSEEWPPYLVEREMDGTQEMGEMDGVEHSDGTEVTAEMERGGAMGEDTDMGAAPDGVANGGRIRAAMIGTLEREDGSTQLTYAGHPLYYYHDDEGPGQTMGQDVTDPWGEWYLVTPMGEPLEDQEGS